MIRRLWRSLWLWIYELARKRLPTVEEPSIETRPVGVVDLNRRLGAFGKGLGPDPTMFTDHELSRLPPGVVQFPTFTPAGLDPEIISTTGFKYRFDSGEADRLKRQDSLNQSMGTLLELSANSGAWSLPDSTQPDSKPDIEPGGGNFGGGGASSSWGGSDSGGSDGGSSGGSND